MKRALKILGAILAVLLLLLAGAVALLATMDWNRMRGPLSDRIASATGRKLAVTGDLALDLLSWHPSLVAEGVTFSNPDWGSRPKMARIGRLAFEVDLRALFHGEVVVTGLHARDVDILLEQNDKGEANWQLGASPGSAAVDVALPDDRTRMPTIRRLDIENATVTYRGATLVEPITARFDRLEGQDLGDQVALAARGIYKDKPFVIDAGLGDFALLRDPRQPYPLAVNLRIGDTRARLDGTVADPFAFTGFDTRLELAGKSLGELNDILGLALPASPVYELVGHLTNRPSLWRVEQMTARLGSSDVAGLIAIGTEGKTPQLTAELRSRSLDFKDLAGFVGEKEVEGKASGAQETEEDEPWLLPDDPINLEKLRRLDAKVTFAATRIRRGGLLFNDFSTSFVLKDGKLTMQPLNFGLARGRVAGTLVLDGSQPRPRLHADMRLRGVDLGVLLAPLDPDKATWGRLGGRLDIRARGRSVHDLAANMDGKLVAWMTEGEIGNVLLEAVALDLSEVVASWMGKDKDSPIQCLIAPFEIAGGVMRTEHLMLAAAEDIVIGKGFLDFRTERLQITFIPYPRDFSLFNAPTRVTLGGTLKNRDIKPHTGELIGQIAKKILLMPLVPFMEMMKEDEAPPCAPVERITRQEEKAQSR